MKQYYKIDCLLIINIRAPIFIADTLIRKINKLMIHFYKHSIKEIKNHMGVAVDKGLSTSDVEKRLKEYGKNRLISKKKKSLLMVFFQQFKSFMVLILLVAAAVSGVIGIMHGEGLLDTYIILGILLVNAIIGVVQERNAESSLEALNRMSTPHSKVLRNGEVSEISAIDIVPGDIVVLDTGDIIPADLRLIETINLKVQESALTGESVPVIKHTNTLKGEDIPLGDTENMAFSTGMVTYGRGRGIVVATGMQTEVGKIADMLQHTESTETPMKHRLEELGKILGYAALAICALIFVVGVAYGNSVIDTFMMAVSLAVAAIPEGLQVISTVVLAMGVKRLVKSNAIVRTLPSVESLGSATVICSDKTGTLTQNKMTVVEGWTTNGSHSYKDSSQSQDAFDKLHTSERTLLMAGLLCTDAHLKVLSDGTAENSGDPTETAIVDVALKYGVNKNEAEDKYKRVSEVPFDSERKRMATINKHPDGRFIVNVKGGLDEVLGVVTNILVGGEVRAITDDDIATITEQNNQMAQNAIRVLAIAQKEIEDIPSDVRAKTVEADLTFVGLLGMIDPARPEAIEAVRKCRTAGIRPVMITGDHKVTAVAIAKEIGIYNEGDIALTGSELEKLSDDDLFNNVHKYSVYARVAPEHKVRIVKAWQAHGEVVSMTGDGVNDAPALKQADIGTAMGIVGTEVAKDASDIILTDDNFATIVSAIEEGRRIYDNILKSIQFLLSANVGEVLVIFIASMFNIGNPLLPIHILWINLVTDSFPALALSVDPAEKDIMTRNPRDAKKGFFTKGMTWRIVYQGATIGLISLVAYLLGRNDGGQELGQTMTFAVLAFSQLFHVRNLHSNRLSSFRTSVFKNKALIAGILLSAAMMLAILLHPTFMKAFKLVEMDAIHWLYVLGLSITPVVVVELFKLFKINSFKDEY